MEPVCSPPCRRVAASAGSAGSPQMSAMRRALHGGTGTVDASGDPGSPSAGSAVSRGRTDRVRIESSSAQPSAPGGVVPAYRLESVAPALTARIGAATAGGARRFAFAVARLACGAAGVHDRTALDVARGGLTAGPGMDELVRLW